MFLQLLHCNDQYASLVLWFLQMLLHELHFLFEESLKNVNGLLKIKLKRGLVWITRNPVWILSHKRFYLLILKLWQEAQGLVKLLKYSFIFVTSDLDFELETVSSTKKAKLKFPENKFLRIWYQSLIVTWTKTKKPERFLGTNVWINKNLNICKKN